MGKIIVSGIQPTGNLHLGNYLGAIRNWVAMQNACGPDDKCLFFLADLHAITLPHSPDDLRRNSREMAAALIACGIDPARSIIFRQSDVPAHAELAWLLFCTARIGWLNRMTQFKDKAGKNREGMSIGFFAYPVLQAADVLLYQTTHVPVGDDQKQHLELVRDIAIKFNNDYDTNLFALPEAIITPSAARIMSLRDGSKKMSKSDESDMSRINLTDDATTITNKIKKAKSDAELLPDVVAGLRGRAEAENLIRIYSAVTQQSEAEALVPFAGLGFGMLKTALADVLVAQFAPISKHYKQLLIDPTYIDGILADGAKQARILAAPTLARAYEILGLKG